MISIYPLSQIYNPILCIFYIIPYKHLNLSSIANIPILPCKMLFTTDRIICSEMLISLKCNPYGVSHF